DGWRQLAASNPANTQLLRQGYLSSDPARVVRVRSVDAKAFLTIKGQNEGIVRAEWEYPIPLADAEAMLAICQRPLIEKYRSRIMFGGFCWEVDEFLGENAGLIVAEIELPSAEQEFAKPDWIGEEVSDDQRYKNSNLGRHPFSQWGRSST
ncbi:MAG: CYTH domain-containing protein, partial [Burkholderiales bacterium]|nr:CYTH domain-containing protein [Burkholderiales bacterium]